MKSEQILQFFEGIQNIVSISLFGSHAKKKETASSDIDIAVLFEKDAIPSLEKTIEWRESLEVLLEKEVDLVCLNTVSPILRMQVHINGKVLQVRNQQEYAKYQMLLFSGYAELKELRAPMEGSILKRKYYG